MNCDLYYCMYSIDKLCTRQLHNVTPNMYKCAHFINSQRLWLKHKSNCKEG